MRLIVITGALMILQGCIGIGTAEESGSVDLVIDCQDCEHLRITRDVEDSSSADKITIGPAGGGNQ